MEMEDRGVAYINTDVCMAGSYLEPAASPTMAHLFKSATKVNKKKFGLVD